jgi:hypothetical protein
VAWDVAEREDSKIAADLVGRACLRERISKGRRQPLVEVNFSKNLKPCRLNKPNTRHDKI